MQSLLVLFQSNEVQIAEQSVECMFLFISQIEQTVGMVGCIQGKNNLWFAFVQAEIRHFFFIRQLLQARHQSTKYQFDRHQVCATCVAHLGHGVAFHCASMRVNLSAGSPSKPKKHSWLWSHPAAPGGKWGLIPRKPLKDTEECLAQSKPFTQGLDRQKLNFTQSFTRSCCGSIYTCGFVVCICKF